MADIAIHLPDLRGGGAERVMVNLADEFVTRGHSVEFVLSQVEGHHLQNVSEDIKIRDLDARQLPGYTAMGALWPLKNYIEEEQPDVLLTGIARANIVALLAHRLADTESRIVVTEHNTLSRWLQDEGGLRMRAVPYLIRVTYPWADEIVAVSDGVADDLSKTTGLKRSSITTIYNPVVTAELYEQADAPSPHPWFDDDVPVILGAGSLTTQKDFPALIRAFARVREQREAKLIITGKGPEKEKLQSLIEQLDLEDDAMLAGFVDNPYAYISHASVFVLSSKYEGLPTVLIEALACETPVVSTDCPSGPREILHDGELGPLVPVGDECVLADAICGVLYNPLSSHTFKERAKDFEPVNIVDEYLTILLATNYGEME